MQPCDRSDAKLGITGDLVNRDRKRGDQRDKCAAQVDGLRGSFDTWQKSQNVGR